MPSDESSRQKQSKGDGQGELTERLAALEARVAGLSDQVAELAARPGEGGEALLVEAIMRRFMPDEAVDHMKAARRENLLALRATVDAWIARIDRSREGKEPLRRRESISLD